MSVNLLLKQNSEAFTIFVHSCSESKTCETKEIMPNIYSQNSPPEYLNDKNKLSINPLSTQNYSRRNNIKEKSRDSITSSTLKVSQGDMQDLLKKLKKRNKRQQSSCSCACIII
ncbi:hypothetical protein SteCoe_13784 [Stentor coeruleus]|uniref:Uncharacterized protein n=1 Tax=Stentor coeruleus TaxID=5963 RepID=A0A1R2C7M1_9CILI|nr:hypothetical protein SteCoe_13784 [Stentor coeruleus]